MTPSSNESRNEDKRAATNRRDRTSNRESEAPPSKERRDSPPKEPAEVHLQFSIEDPTARPSEKEGSVTDNRRVNAVLARHGTRDYRADYPQSKVEELRSVFSLRCDSCDAEALKSDLMNTGAFGEIRVIPPPVALSYGNPGGYDPADYFWTAHAQDWMWNMVITKTDLAWNMTQGDPNVIVAVIDNGFDVTHPDLATKMSPYDPATGNLLAVASHGTSTATIAAGETALTGTVAAGQMPSVGFNSGLQGYMWGGTSAAHHAALVENVEVISISWFSGCLPNSWDQLAIQEILDEGTTIVAAAGNGPMHCGGQDLYPFSALYDERVIVVTSTNEDDLHDDPGSQTHSHYPRVDLAAPSYGVMGGTMTSGSTWPYFGGWGGTSQATPLVAGSVALMKSMNSCLKPSDVQEILKNSTDPILDAANFPGLVGTGRINTNRAVALTQAVDYACPQGGTWDTANCHIGFAPAGTSAFIWGGNYYYSPLPGNSCPYPGSWFDGANCFVQEVPEGVQPFIWANGWYYASCAQGGWTEWLDRDNASGTGDWELLSEFPSVCDEPVAIQCRAKSGTYFTQTSDQVVTCERDIGLICKNNEQLDGYCEDYEVRFYCP